ncbi:hypothetical protein Droror1_Dr00004213 [Drosera rotundifolia]
MMAFRTPRWGLILGTVVLVLLVFAVSPSSARRGARFLLLSSSVDETTDTAGRLLLEGESVAINDYDGPTANPGHEPPRLKETAGATPRGRKDPQNP